MAMPPPDWFDLAQSPYSCLGSHAYDVGPCVNLQLFDCDLSVVDLHCAGGQVFSKGDIDDSNFALG